MQEFLSVAEVAALRRLVDARGEVAVAQDLGIDVRTLARLLARLPARTITVRACRASLTRVRA